MGIHGLRPFFKKNNVKFQLLSKTELNELIKSENLVVLVDTGDWSAILKRCIGNSNHAYASIKKNLESNFEYFFDDPESISTQKESTQLERLELKKGGLEAMKKFYVDLNLKNNNGKVSRTFHKRWKKLLSRNYPIEKKSIVSLANLLESDGLKIKIAKREADVAIIEKIKDIKNENPEQKTLVMSQDCDAILSGATYWAESFLINGELRYKV